MRAHSFLLIVMNIWMSSALVYLKSNNFCVAVLTLKMDTETFYSGRTTLNFDAYIMSDADCTQISNEIL